MTIVEIFKTRFDINLYIIKVSNNTDLYYIEYIDKDDRIALEPVSQYHQAFIEGYLASN